MEKVVILKEDEYDALISKLNNGAESILDEYINRGLTLMPATIGMGCMSFRLESSKNESGEVLNDYSRSRIDKMISDNEDELKEALHGMCDKVQKDWIEKRDDIIKRQENYDKPRNMESIIGLVSFLAGVLICYMFMSS